MANQSGKRFSPKARARSRRTAVQACYQWLITSRSMPGIIREFEEGNPELKKADLGYFRELLLGIASHSQELDEKLQVYLDRPLAEVNLVETAVLKIGMFELVYRPEVPWRVVMNEMIELAKMFGAEQSHRYINGVLDRAAREIRAVEVGARV